MAVSPDSNVIVVVRVNSIWEALIMLLRSSIKIRASADASLRTRAQLLAGVLLIGIDSIASVAPIAPSADFLPDEGDC